MASALLRESTGTFQHAFAAQLGCEPSAFASQALTIVERPPDSWEPHLAIAAECGIGSVVSPRDLRLETWAAEQQLESHFRIFLPSFLEGMAEKARELGYAAAKSHSPSVGMVLAEDVPLPGIPNGLAVVELSASRIAELRKAGDFGNALGETDEHDKLARFKRATVLPRPAGEVVAACGVWEQYPGID